ncbi:MAG: cupin domain-containing protein [Endomicrobia bacterium]|nr:cupin domain-containing protein [Endomicrobiia bacterium]
MKYKNNVTIYNMYEGVKCCKGAEIFDTIVKGKAFKIEKIVSNGAVSPEGFWYKQKLDEIVFLLKGRSKISFYNGEMIKLKSGDYILIPKNVKHRVEYTSTRSKCVWLCVFGKFL